ncbi:hypothetical protein SAMN02745121_08947 [Nannocystis exedens]|uniref:PrcB C-terminal n=1 Tax=Nannocystis exedens TaxID=54 RepID=A0A1I2ISB9_9BACT|nr:hypothetical protein [Nannocystis exedens]PCC69450.1 hypothetical protein NAEX_02472 [Nannocystis exedens]SFF45205.1 hypothetical protein SAMN02745121_08947 [Nannocystis exedens]
MKTSLTSMRLPSIAWMTALLLCACTELDTPLLERVVRIAPDAAEVDEFLGCKGGGVLNTTGGDGWALRIEREWDGEWSTRYRVFAITDEGEKTAVLVDHTIDEDFLAGEDELVLPFSARGVSYELRVSVDGDGQFDCG